MKRDDDANVWEFFNERAAIMTFDAGIPRHDADFRAMVRTRLYFEPRGIAMPMGGYFSCFWNTEFGWSDSAGAPVTFPCAVALLSMWYAARDEADRAGRCYTWLLRPPADRDW
ncbi:MULTISPECIES: hypothetical protein [Burkholderia cepacia complex]|uniref:Uncharacterized protein n=1 Tax=Burkholderia stabilis TaxID=95485 RepID=A0AAJ5N8U8_9BURK|nr:MULTISPECIES: hypothetical protein [Burkholderia cepacia complex]VBB13947.1 hypothetical protein BSTAB16_4133 [Burkholderia stabilis]VWB67830.1 hypothetical protein BCO23253_03209 [Burkholderia contaminans]